MQDCLLVVNPLPSEFGYVLRLLLAVAAGAMVGVEREYRGRPAGLRTHILVALGAAILSIASLELTKLVNAGPEMMARVDVSRIAAGMITGIGFLGAGTIIKMGKSVRGLTTAASVWCVATIGMGFGFGFYLLSFLGSALMIFTLIIVSGMEREIARDWYKNVIVQIGGPQDNIYKLRDRLHDRGWKVIDLSVRKNKTDPFVEVEYEMRIKGKNEQEAVIRLLDEVDYVLNYRVE